MTAPPSSASSARLASCPRARRAARREPGRRTRAGRLPRLSGPSRSGYAPLAFPIVNQFCTVILYGRGGRLTAQNGDFRPGQCEALPTCATFDCAAVPCPRPYSTRDFIPASGPYSHHAVFTLERNMGLRKRRRAGCGQGQRRAHRAHAERGLRCCTVHRRGVLRGGDLRATGRQ